MVRGGQVAAGPGRAARVRLQRVLAEAGIASRRDCEQLIRAGRVAVNGRTVRRLPVLVDPRQDRIEVDGRPMPPAPPRVYLMLNKPGRTLTTRADEPGADRRTVLDLVDHPARSTLVPVGRLDYDTRGLVVLTNDRALVHRLTHPRYGVGKTYEVLVRGSVSDAVLARLCAGVKLSRRREGRTVGGERVSAVAVRVVRREADRTLLRLTLHGGRNRQVRRMLAAVGHPVRSLRRVAIGPVRLRGLRPGQWRPMTRAEVRALRASVRLRPADRRRNRRGTSEPAP